MSGMDPVVPADEARSEDADVDLRDLPTYSGDAEPPTAEDTRRVDALITLGEAADQAIAEGYIGRAEQLLSAYLTDVLKTGLAEGQETPRLCP